jgi:hypothetical protein
MRMNKSRRMRWTGHVARMVEKRNTCRLLMGKPEIILLLRRQRCRWVDNNKMNVGEKGRGDVDWIGLVQDKDKWRALVNAVMHLRVP